MGVEVPSTEEFGACKYAVDYNYTDAMDFFPTETVRMPVPRALFPLCGKTRLIFGIFATSTGTNFCKRNRFVFPLDALELDLKTILLYIHRGLELSR